MLSLPTCRHASLTIRVRYCNRLQIRLNPDSLVVDCGDQAFARSNGGGTAFVQKAVLPYAVVGSCAGNGGETGLGQIDLRGTPFAVDPGAGAHLSSFNASILEAQGEPRAGWFCLNTTGDGRHVVQFACYVDKSQVHLAVRRSLRAWAHSAAALPSPIAIRQARGN